MKRIGVVVALAGGLASVVPAVTADEIKIGVVNAFKVLEGSPQAEKAKKTLDKEFAARNRTLTDQMKFIKDTEDKLEKDAAVMSEAEVSKLRRDIQTKRRDVQRDGDELRDDFNLRRNEEFGKIQKEIVSTIQAVAKEKGLDLVLGEGVVFASSKVDITPDVLERLKKGGGGDAK